jgi:hypothetical protein
MKTLEAIGHHVAASDIFFTLDVSRRQHEALPSATLLLQT